MLGELATLIFFDLQRCHTEIFVRILLIQLRLNCRSSKQPYAGFIIFKPSLRLAKTEKVEQCSTFLLG
jgi:hypothetical protein